MDMSTTILKQMYKHWFGFRPRKKPSTQFNKRVRNEDGKVRDAAARIS